MIGATSGGKDILVSRDLGIHIPYGAGMFDLRMDASKYGLLTFDATHALSAGLPEQMGLAGFLAQRKQSTDGQLSKATAGSVRPNAS